MVPKGLARRASNLDSQKELEYLREWDQIYKEGICTIPVNDCSKDEYGNKIRRSKCNKYYNKQTKKPCRKGVVYGCRENSEAIKENEDLNLICQHFRNIEEAEIKAEIRNRQKSLMAAPNYWKLATKVKPSPDAGEEGEATISEHVAAKQGVETDVFPFINALLDSRSMNSNIGLSQTSRSSISKRTRSQSETIKRDINHFKKALKKFGEIDPDEPYHKASLLPPDRAPSLNRAPALTLGGTRKKKTKKKNKKKRRKNKTRSYK